MIIVRLIGGLGNQLFQYAAARQLSKIHQTGLKIDISGFKEYKNHRYSLTHFSIIEDYISKEETFGIEEIKAKYFHFDPEFREIPDNIILTGYWQTEKYFIGISEIIRDEFTVKYPLKDKDLEISRLIKDSNSVSMHIRRCDYLPGTFKDQIFDCLSPDYYINAVKRLSEEESNLVFFIFSDDPEWSKDNIKLEYPCIFVEHNTADTNYEDLRLMSLCKHSIIANSSFGWWGAWLNKNQNKKVYAPKRWFNSNVRNLDPKDIIPSAWIKI
ncbi:MAG: alpha-1,2-fucosyltransferase [Candidatus Omnitrophota bacterium]